MDSGRPGGNGVITVVLADGSRRNLSDADVSLSWVHDDGQGNETVDVYALADVKALLVINPNLKTMAGQLHGMPIMGAAFEDDTDTGIRIEIPMPLGFANDLGQQLVKETDRYAAALKLAATTDDALRNFRSGDNGG